MKKGISLLLAMILAISCVVSLSVSASAYSLSTPSFSSIEVIDGGVQFSWESMGSDVLYRIYYKDGNDWRRLTTTANTSFVDRDVRSGSAYTYTIRCLNKTQSTFLSDFNRTGWHIKYYDTPQVNAVTSNLLSDDHYKYIISWKGVAGASRYGIEMRYEGETTWRRLKFDVKGTSVSHVMDKHSVNGDHTRPRAYRVYVTDGEYKLSGAGVTPYYMPDEEYEKLENRPNTMDATGWYNALLSSMNTNGFDWDDCPGVNRRSSNGKTDTDLMTLVKSLKLYGGTKERLLKLRRCACTRQFVANSLVAAYDYSAKPLCTTYDKPMDASRLKKSGNKYYAKDTMNSNMNTVAHYGWFTPDYYGKLYPNRLVSADEMDRLMEELKLYETWHGKTVVSFGDSIMHGRGVPTNTASYNSSNSDYYDDTLADSSRDDYANKRYPRYDHTRYYGICEFIGEKYGMKHRDYSYPGATMGVELVKNTSTASSAKWQFSFDAPYKSHIANQVRAAIKEGQKADLILLNGGTNDMHLSSINPYSNKSGDVYEYGYYPSNEFSGWTSSSVHQQYGHKRTIQPSYYATENSYNAAFIKTMNLLTGNDSEAANSKMKNAPIVYVQSQEMNMFFWCKDYLTEQKWYGDKAVMWAKDYGQGKTYVADTRRFGFDANCSSCFMRYIHEDGDDSSNGIHPNSLGYSKFYLPAIERQLLEIDR